VRSDIELMFFLVLGLAMVAVLIALLVLLYFAYFRIVDIDNGLGNSRFFLLRRSLMGADPVSRFFMIISVGMVFAFPSRYLKNGELDADDFRSFPAGLMVGIKGFYLFGLIVGLAMFAMAGVGKLMGWVK
jgi:hypothetical protein